MRRVVLGLGLALLALAVQPSAFAGECADDPRLTGLSRVIAIDSTNGPVFGKHQYVQTAPLKDKEVVLTFDDGPLPEYTKPILDTLDKHCVKATFFPVGRMAWHNAGALKEILRRGHTIAAHSWSHPRSLATLPLDDAKLEIEKGFVAVSHALGGGPVAPFFRFPGLNDSAELRAYLAERNISVWSVDVVSGDTTHESPGKLLNDTLNRLRPYGRGILLFHDIKRVTAVALDSILTALKQEGYKVVHVVSNAAYKPDAELSGAIDFTRQPAQPMPFTGQPVSSTTAQPESKPKQTARPVPAGQTREEPQARPGREPAPRAASTQAYSRTTAQPAKRPPQSTAQENPNGTALDPLY